MAGVGGLWEGAGWGCGMRWVPPSHWVADGWAFLETEMWN